MGFGLEEVAKVEYLIPGLELGIGNHETESARAELAACERETVQRFRMVARVADDPLDDLPGE